MSALQEKTQELSFLLELRNSSNKTVELLSKIQKQLDTFEQHQASMLQVAANWMNIFELAKLVDIKEADTQTLDSADISDTAEQVLLIPLSQSENSVYNSVNALKVLILNQG
ncbi:hypothetical protein BB561_002876 [Smittium simulii]|uniref:Uncharacterized protein n=1 Tax=Smittium simulii TaxID=133385 RepID=A0A2T9YNU0_9FUNG|nr:hypothetical protein BB561_002876 [Smittium simulii]